MPEVKNLPVGCLYEHPDNPRKALGDLTELADSLKANGFLQNLMVVPAKEVIAVWNALMEDPDGTDPVNAYVVVIGHRRLAAAKQAGISEVPCVVASMTPQEQARTMLMENMQRSELTPYEQAMGFQMMLNLGDTVETIARDSGFSVSTVRSRVKLLKFKDKTFREATEKQITLETLSEVAKIEDAKKRDKVLATYGTNNFSWELSQALTSQEAKKNAPAAKAEILAYATEVKEIDYVRWEHVMTVNFARYVPGSATPKDGTKGEFVAKIGPESASVYKKSARKSRSKKKSKEEQEKAQEIKRRETELAELTESAYKLRLDFLKNLSVGKADYPKLMKHACYAMLASQIQYCGNNFTNAFTAFLGMKSLSHLTPRNVCDSLMEEAEKAKPCVKPLIAAIYAAYGDSKNKGYWQKSYSGEFPYHSPNPILDYIYGFLCEFGYEMSDTEKALKDGSHSLLLTEDKAAPKETEAVTETDGAS